MQAIVLAGGKGKRLRPYTTIFPKPLMPINETPILEIIIKQLKYYGVDEITLAVGYLKELLQAYFNEGQKWNIKINYSFEEKPLGTAAPIRLINCLDENFLVMNGDVLTTLDFKEFYDFHINSNSICTIAMYSKPVKIDLGVLEHNEDNELVDYIEKPTLNYKVSMGVYAFNHRVLDFIPNNEYFDFPDLIQLLIKKKEKVMGYNFDGHWLDIGRNEDYQNAIDIFNDHEKLFLKDR
jgi:NDP-mannose synthase